MIKKQRTIVLIFSFIIIGILAIGIGVAYYINTSLNYQESLQDMSKQPDVQEENNPEIPSGSIEDIGTESNIYILFLGIDKTEEREEWLGVYRSDTIVIAKIGIADKKIQILSIPRDTYTYIPIEKKNDKINHAYAFGSTQGDGVSASIDAVNELVGEKIVNYYFLMNMEPIPTIVDEIGGVKVDVEIDMKDHGANLSKGLQILNGQQAFDYIHWRYSAGGDIDRIKRQQKFASALYKQQRDSGKILETLNITIKHWNDIKTNLSMKQMIGLAQLLSEIPDENVEYSYIPGRGKMIDNISYWVPEKEKTAELLEKFLK